MKMKISSVGIIGAALCMAAIFLILPYNVQAKSIELSVAVHIPGNASPIGKAFMPWTNEITKQTEGRITFKYYFSQTLLKARDAYQGVEQGIADITWVPFSMQKGRFPLASVVELPYLSPSTEVGSQVLIDLYKKFPEMRAEIDGVHLLFLWVSLPYELHTNKPVRAPQDFKGMKIATVPGANVALETLGAVPITMPSIQIYQTVEKGVVDGIGLPWGAYNAYKLYEVTKYHVNAHLAGVGYCVVMNQNKWDSFSKQDQEIITRVTGKMMPDALCAAVSDELTIGQNKAKELGQEVIDMTPEEHSKWKAIGKPVWDKWVQEMEAKGLPGQKVLDETIELVEKYSK